MKTLYFPKFQRAFLKMPPGVGWHPVFGHMANPPEGYRFDSTPLTWAEWLTQLPAQCGHLWRRVGELRAFGKSLGLSRSVVYGFVKSRGLSRIVPAPKGTVATYLPTYPLSHLNEDWFVELEDTTTILDPYALNGRTKEVRFREMQAFPLIRQLLESPRCLGILTHVESTQAGVRKLFQSDVIAKKTTFLPLGYVPPISISEADLDRRRVSHPVRFFFSNSAHQDANNFFLRGGVFILESFEQLLSRNYPVTLTLRSALPRAIESRFASLLAHPSVDILDRYLEAEEYVDLLSASHYLLLPAARLHVVAILEAMYYGAVPIVSDGWGIQEHLEDDVTGHVVPGIYGRVSWIDSETGALKEDYEPMYRTPGILSEALLLRLTRLLEEPSDRAAVALRAHRRVRDRHNVDLFNRGLSQFLDRALVGRSSVGVAP